MQVRRVMAVLLLVLVLLHVGMMRILRGHGLLLLQLQLLLLHHLRVQARVLPLYDLSIKPCLECLIFVWAEIEELMNDILRSHIVVRAEWHGRRGR
jgi:hypothetical protein